MNKMLIVGCMAMMVVILAYVCWSQHNEILTLQKLSTVQAQISIKPVELAKPAELKRTAQEMSSAKANATIPRKTAAETPSVPALASPPMTPGPAGSFISQKGTNSTPPLAAIFKMMKSPAMKNMIKEQTKMTLDHNYGALFKGLNLAPEDQDALKSLLVERQMALLDGSMAMMDKGTSAEEKKKFGAQIESVSKDYDEKFKTLLGSENYDIYKQYEETQPERMQVNLFKNGLPEAQALNEDQEGQLIRAMYEERQNVMPNVKPEAATSPEAIKDMMTTQAQKMDQLMERYAQRAAAILTPEQLGQFKQHQEQQKAMQKVGMEMAKEMFGGTVAEGQDVSVSVHTVP